MLLRIAFGRSEDGPAFQQRRVESRATLIHAENAALLVERQFQERPICIVTAKDQIEGDVLS